MVSTYGMLRRRAARVCVLSESRRISGELSILSRMAVALVPARGRRLTSGGRCVDFTPQPSALVRSASRTPLRAPSGARVASGFPPKATPSTVHPDIRRTCTRRTSPRRGTAGLQGKPRGAVLGCGASSRAGGLGGIPPAPPARKSACPRARLSRPPLTPRASSCGRLRA